LFIGLENNEGILNKQHLCLNLDLPNSQNVLVSDERMDFVRLNASFATMQQRYNHNV
jgi:hypothetical protein